MDGLYQFLLKNFNKGERKLNKNIKSIISAGIFTGALLFGTSAYASTDSPVTVDLEQVNVNSGVTPDNFFYFMDQLGEDLQLLFTSDVQKESELLLQFAQERLSESSQMAEESKDQYITSLIDSYLATLQEAQEKVSEVLIDESVDQQVKEQLSLELENATTVDESVENVLEDGKLEELNEKQQEAFLVANVVKDLISKR
jgi:hypothetical protein